MSRRLTSSPDRRRKGTRPAAATRPVRASVLQRRAVDRPNLRLAVERCGDEATKRRAVLFRLARTAPPGVIYVATRRHAEELAALVSEHGHRAVYWHGGMEGRQREAVRAAFLTREAQVMVAASPLGRGLDVPDLRFVFHYDVSDSIDSYYEEITRAGRDGRPAEATLFYRRADLALHRFFAAGGQADEDQIRRVAEAIGARPEPVTPRELAGILALSSGKIRGAVQGLQQAGAVEILAGGELVARFDPEDLAGTAHRARLLGQQQQERRLGRIEMMRAYAETEQCRRKYLVNSLGQAYSPPCGNCDNCLCGPTAPAEDGELGDAVLPGSRPFPEKSWVLHPRWGKGMVARYERNKIVVLFDAGGCKTFLLSAVAPALHPLEASP